MTCDLDLHLARKVNCIELSLAEFLSWREWSDEPPHRNVLNMSRIQQINPESVIGNARELTDAVKVKREVVPNMTRAMANAPAVLDGYLSLSGEMGNGALSARDRERIALAVGQANGCDYCLAAHSAVGKMIGLTTDQILDTGCDQTR